MNQTMKILTAALVTTLAILAGSSHGQDGSTPQAAPPMPAAQIPAPQTPAPPTTAAKGISTNKPAALPAKPLTAYAVGTTVRDTPIVHIAMSVLEIDADHEADLDPEIKRLVPHAESGTALFDLGHVDTETSAKLVRSLVENKIADVISRPQIMTVSGQTATVQVGQKVKMPDGLIGGDDAEVGLTIACSPRVTSDQNKVQLELHLTHATIADEGKTQLDRDAPPVIHRRAVTSMLEMNSRETIALKGPTGYGSLLVLLTPTVNPLEAHPQSTAVAPKPVAPVSDTPATKARGAGLMAQLQKIKETIQTVAPDSLQEVSLEDREFELRAILDSSQKVNRVAAVLGELKGVEIETLRVSSSGDLTQMSMTGTLAGDLPKPNSTSSAKRRPRPDTARSSTFVNLETALQELFPDEKIVLREINRAVLIRGTVSPRSMPIIISVAENYYPTVINDLTASGPNATKPTGVIRQSVPPTAWMPHPVKPMVTPPPPNVLQQIARPPAPKTAYRSDSNQLKTRSTDAPPIPPANLHEEVRALRGEVKALRADVRRLIQLVAEKSGRAEPANRLGQPPKPYRPVTPSNAVTPSNVSPQGFAIPPASIAPRPAKPPRATATPHPLKPSFRSHSRPSDAPKPRVNSGTKLEANSVIRRPSKADWQLSLNEVLSIAQQNDPDQAKALSPGEYRKGDKAESVRQAFEQLRVARTVRDAVDARRSQAEELKAVLDEQNPTFSQFQSIAARKGQEDLQNIERWVTQSEVSLRKLMGLSAQDGRAIAPLKSDPADASKKDDE